MYYYYYALHLTHKRKYEQAYLILNDLEKTSPIMALMGYLADKMYLLNYQEKYLKLLEEFDHTPFNPYNDYIEYIRLKFEQYSYNNLYNFLKNTVLEKNLIYKHYFLLSF